MTDSDSHPIRLVLAGMVAAIVIMSAYVSEGQRKSPVSEAFVLQEKDLIPEGMAYDPVDQVFYIGSIAKQKIIRVTLKGKQSDFAVSLRQMLGLKVDAQRRRLWACGNSTDSESGEHYSSVYVFSLENGALLKRYQVSGKKKRLFNDLVINGSGDVFITDSDGGAVYVVRHDKDQLDELIPTGALTYPNGIVLTPDERHLLISTGSGLGIVAVDVSSREVKKLTSERYLLIGIDGMYTYRQSIIGIQNVTFPEAVLRISTDAGFSAVTGIEFLAVGLSAFQLPTTGVVVDDWFYFIANSQLNQFDESTGSIKDPASLKNTVVMRIKLN